MVARTVGCVPFHSPLNCFSFEKSLAELCLLDFETSSPRSWPLDLRSYFPILAWFLAPLIDTEGSTTFIAFTKFLASILNEEAGDFDLN